MIVKGGSRSSASYWSKHLLRTDHNERVEILELPPGFAATQAGLYEILQGWQDLTKLTAKGEKGFYCGHIDPDGKYAMSGQDWQTTLAIKEAVLGYQGQSRLVVKHVKDGREHVHALWQRARVNERGQWELISDSWNYKKHEIAARRMEAALGHEHIKGVFTGRARDPETGRCLDERPVAEINHAEWQQGERTGKDPRTVKAEIAALWRDHKDGHAFKSALEQSGYALAQGDKKPVYMVVDRTGEAYELRRCIKGVKKPEIEKRLAAYPAKELETVAEIRAAMRERRQAQQQQQGQHRPPIRLRTDWLKGRFVAANDNRILREGQTRQRKERELEAEIAVPMQRREAMRGSFASAAAVDVARHVGQAAQLEAERDRQEVLSRTARQAWREIAEPMERREALTVAFSHVRQAEAKPSPRIAIEDEREQEEKLRTGKRKERLVDKKAEELYGLRNDMQRRHLDKTRAMETEHDRQTADKAAELEPYYGRSIRRLEKTIAAARERLEQGGTVYNLLFAWRDRQTVEARTMQLENARQREEEAWAPLKQQQRQERERVKESQAGELRGMDTWIREELDEYERSLDPPEHERDNAREQTAEHGRQHTRGDSGGAERSRSLTAQASPVKSRRRDPVRPSGRDRRRGKPKYRPARDIAMPERRQRYGGERTITPRSGINPRRVWTANAREMVQALRTPAPQTPGYRPAPAPRPGF